jgi:hypothetical protein
MKKSSILICSIIVIFVFTYIEFVHPYHFLRNDNLFQFFGPMQYSIKTFLAGNMPLLNPFQNMGVPLYEMGYFPVLYPPLLLSYLISIVLKNEYLLFEIFIFLHVLLSTIITAILINKTIKDEIISTASALSFVFCGYILIKLHDWYFLAPTLILLPLVFLLHKIYEKNRETRLFIWLGITRGVFIYSGHIQFFIYTLFFELIYNIILLLNKTYKTKDLAFYILSLGISFTIGLPNILMMFLMNIDSARTFSLAGYFLSNSVNPISFIINNIIPINSNQYFINTFLFFGFLAATFTLLKKKKSSMFLKNPYISLALLAIILSFGIYGIVYNFLAIVPVWNKFIHPEKFLVFAAFFVTICGSTYIASIIKRRLHKILFLIICLVMIIIQIPRYSETMDLHRDDLPFESLKLTGEGRVLTIIENENPYKYQYHSENYATLENIRHVSGYEHLAPKLNKYIVPVDRDGKLLYDDLKLDEAILGEYSVRWIISDRKRGIGNALIEDTEKKQFIYEINDTRPILSYLETREEITFSDIPNGIRFTTTEGGTAIFSNIYHSAYILYIDGTESEVAMDVYGRMSFTVPDGTHEMKILYKRDLFFVSFAFSILLLAVVLLSCDFIEKSLTAMLDFASAPLSRCINLFQKNIILTILIFGIIYSGFIYMNLKKQGFIDNAIECKDDLSFTCISKAHDGYEHREMCRYLEQKNIKYTLLGSFETIC